MCRSRDHGWWMTEAADDPCSKIAASCQSHLGAGVQGCATTALIARVVIWTRALRCFIQRQSPPAALHADVVDLDVAVAAAAALPGLEACVVNVQCGQTEGEARATVSSGAEAEPFPGLEAAPLWGQERGVRSGQLGVRWTNRCKALFAVPSARPSKHK